MKSDRRLYLDSSRSVVVEEGDARASFLLVGSGCELDDNEAARLGILPGEHGLVVATDDVPDSTVPAATAPEAPLEGDPEAPKVIEFGPDSPAIKKARKPR